MSVKTSLKDKDTVKMIDILNRDGFVNQLVNLVENISTNKSSTCFAINGAWGCGKSFVLDMFEEKLCKIQSVETSNDKYFIIRYNCWKYDYYEEPLIAIVSTIISTIEEKTKLFLDDKTKREILGMLKATAISLLSIANNYIKEQTGVDFQNAFETVLSGKAEGAESFEADHDYDYYFSFNKVMSKLMDLLKTISESYTVVLLVDELDRCMPQYAVKVLERLHHLTEGGTNIITAISIDKAQLMTGIKKLFGFENPEKYLEKFIHFEIELDFGTITERINEKYSDYIELFDKELFQFEESIEECMQLIFKNIDARKQEQLINKAMVAHKLLFADKKDYCFMCMELLLTLVICINNGTDFLEQTIHLGSTKESFFKNIFLPIYNTLPDFFEYIYDKLDDIVYKTNHLLPSDIKVYKIPERSNLCCAILYIWYQMHKPNPKFEFAINKDGVYSVIENHHEDLKKFAETINIIK